MKQTDKRGADVVLDLAGGEVFTASLRAAAPGGRVVAMANVTLAPSTIDTRDFYPKNVSIHGFQFTNLQRLGWDPRPDLAALFDDIAKGDFVVPIDSRFPLADAAMAHRRIESNESRGKIVLTMASQP
jgi:NADPH2:quinone reductase